MRGCLVGVHEGTVNLKSKEADMMRNMVMMPVVS